MEVSHWKKKKKFVSAIKVVCEFCSHHVRIESFLYCKPSLRLSNVTTQNGSFTIYINSMSVQKHSCSSLRTRAEGKILNPICHVVVPGSIDFEDLAVVFSAHVYRENKEHVYLSGKI